MLGFLWMSLGLSFKEYGTLLLMIRSSSTVARGSSGKGPAADPMLWAWLLTDSFEGCFLRGLAGTAKKNMLDIIDFAFCVRFRFINDRAVFMESTFFDKEHLLELGTWRRFRTILRWLGSPLEESALLMLDSWRSIRLFNSLISWSSSSSSEVGSGCSYFKIYENKRALNVAFIQLI